MSKKLLLSALALAAMSCLAHAEDAANSAENTVTTSKNPITGSETTTRKHKRKIKNGKNQAKVDVTEKTTVKKDGEVDKSVDVKGTSEEK